MSIHTNQVSTVYFWITPACSTLFQSTLFCCTMGASWSNQTCPGIPEISVVPISMRSSALSPLCRQYHTLHYKSTAKAQNLTFPRACHQSWLPQDHTWVAFIWWITALFYCLSPWLSSLTSYSWNNFIVDNLCILLLINIQSIFFLHFLVCVTVDCWIWIWTHNAKRAMINLGPAPWTPAVTYALSYGKLHKLLPICFNENHSRDLSLPLDPAPF